ncbi:hypothetical protein M885DRAFT_502907 [Pelagophyceae sp. CCMP2097]|nr:hypothetical protein M885DRAFT_502907 [Pelagophyceae sp. CCMP2097]
MDDGALLAALQGVPGQIGAAVLRGDGELLRCSGSLDGDDGVLQAAHRLVGAAAQAVRRAPLRRLTLAYAQYHYVVTLADGAGAGAICVVKKTGPVAPPAPPSPDRGDGGASPSTRFRRLNLKLNPH